MKLWTQEWMRMRVRTVDSRQGRRNVKDAQVADLQNRVWTLEKEGNRLRVRVLELEGTVGFLHNEWKRSRVKDARHDVQEFFQPVDSPPTEDTPTQCPVEHKGPGWWKGASVRCTNNEGHESPHRADGFGVEISWVDSDAH